MTEIEAKRKELENATSSDRIESIQNMSYLSGFNLGVEMGIAEGKKQERKENLDKIDLEIESHQRFLDGFELPKDEIDFTKGQIDSLKEIKMFLGDK